MLVELEGLERLEEVTYLRSRSQSGHREGGGGITCLRRKEIKLGTQDHLNHHLSGYDQ